MNNKGFTLIEILAAVSILSILMGIAVAAVTKYQLKARNSVYENNEKNLRAAAENYLLDNQGDIPEVGASKTIQAYALYDEQYLDALKDPVSKELNCNANSYVIVTTKSNVKKGTYDELKDYYDENGNLIKSNTSNLDIEYKVCLKCSDYESKTCN